MNFIKSGVVFLLLSPLFLSSCFQYKPDIAKCWFYTFESGFKAKSESGLTPASFLCLLKDGTYTRDFGVFDYGHWSYKDLKLHLKSERSQSTDLNIQSLGFNEMTVDMDGGKINFDGQVLSDSQMIPKIRFLLKTTNGAFLLPRRKIPQPFAFVCATIAVSGRFILPGL